MAITTYSEIKSAVADYLNRQDLAAQIPVFVTLAEAQFNRELRVRDMMVRAHTTSSAENVELPEDWLEHYSLVLTPGGTSGPALRYMSEKESNEIKANGATGGTPEGYTLIDDMIELVPAPGDDVELRMVYFARIPALSDDQASNWLLLKSPDLYLYSVLLQAEPYLKNDERIATWSSIRGSLMEAVRLESERALRPTSQLVARARAF